MDVSRRQVVAPCDREPQRPIRSGKPLVVCFRSLARLIPRAALSYQDGRRASPAAKPESPPHRIWYVPLLHFTTRRLTQAAGGAVHNLYRNNWHQVIHYRDNLAQERPPEQWAIDFGEAFSNVVTQNTGPALRRGMARLMQHPLYRDAQGTDDHFMSALFCVGAAGSVEDEGKKNYAGAETWELLNMRNVSRELGRWDEADRLQRSRSFSLETGRRSRM